MASEFRKVRVYLGALLALLVLMACSNPLQAQVVGGTISGNVTDNSGAVLPNATVVMRNVATGVATTVTTNTQGLYSVPNLLPGTYQQKVSASGFETAVRNGITLTVGASIISNIALKVGTVSQTVEVSDLPSDIQTESSTISGVTDSKTIVELPLNGRSWTDLATLQPGVSTIRAIVSVASTDRLGRGLGVQLSISGGRPQQNNYVLDGVSINDYSNQAPGSILGGNLGADAVSEFSVLTSNYSAEYGRTSGGVISAITRSGTNSFHGSAYEFLRNSALDAPNFFDAGTIAPFRRNQFGASAGGPLQKDKTFFFADYEGLRQALGLSEVDTVPSIAARNGQLSAGTVQVSPLVKPYLAFFPLPNGPVFGDTGFYSFAGSAITSENYLMTRIDHKFSNSDSLAGNYMFDTAPSQQNDEFNNKIILSRTRRQMISLEENHVFRPSLMNSFRLGYNRDFAASPAGSKAVNPLAADTRLGYVPGDTVGFIGIPGVTFFTGGLSTQAPASFGWNSVQAYDNVFLTKGIHSLKFGANVERIYDNQKTPSQPGGDFEFNSLADFLTNQPLSLITDAPGISPARYVRETVFGTYAQDDMHLRSNLTLNLGLRYEMATVPSEVHGKLASLQHLTDPAVIVHSPLFANPSLRDFEPRVGFSWDPFRNGKTAVRGGFGVFDVQIFPVNLRHSVDGTVPFYLSANGANLPPGSFPFGAYSLLSASVNSQRAAFIDQHPGRNYVMQWNLNIQRQFGADTTAMIAYVASRAVHNMMQTDDSAIVLPIAKTPEGYLWPLPPTNGSLLPTLNPNFGRVPGTFWNSDSIYHGMELQLQKRMSHGLQAEASYTWSRSIDTASGSTDGDQFQNGISSLFFFDPRLRRGPSDFNQTHNFVLNYTWDVPGPKSLAGPLGWISNGWELGGIFEAASGTPFTVIISPDPLGLNNTDPFDFPTLNHGCTPVVGGVNYLNVNCFGLPLATPDIASRCAPFIGSGSPSQPNGIPGTCANLLGGMGRNSLVGPGLANFDMSLLKNNYVRRISEEFNVQFRVEVFNILNHPNFNPPTANNAIFDGNGNAVSGAGVLTSTATTSRQVQVALKVIW
ncbi:MAG TPA: TonB-dependent receptor [Terriglobales bacterium]|nr:TonB-dependent receptor [Terriglobales bacterium]